MTDGARRVVITGMGIICATGHNVGEFRDALTAGVSGLRRVVSLDVGQMATQVGAEIVGFNVMGWVTESERRLLDRQAVLALIAADEAVRNAGAPGEADATRCGVVLGTGMGTTQGSEAAVLDRAQHGRKPRPMTIPQLMFNSAAAHLAMRYGCQGPSLVVTTACSASAQAIGIAASYIRSGAVDLCLAGGSEAFPSPTFFAAWDSLRVMSTDNHRPSEACRPFSRDRSGLVLGEGAAILVLEEAEHARRRGAQIYGEVAGIGLSSDAFHLTRPNPAGVRAALVNALADARIAPDEVDYVNAHGTATIENDRVETQAIHEVFGDHARRLMVSSTKSAHGHTIGAGGAIEAVATLLALRDGFVPPTLHLTEPDPACDLDYVPGEARSVPIRTALSNSFAFGGHNAVLVLRRVDE